MKTDPGPHGFIYAVLFETGDIKIGKTIDPRRPYVPATFCDMAMPAQRDVPDRHEAEKGTHEACAAYRGDKGQTRRRELFRGLSPENTVRLITAELGAPRAQRADLFGSIESQWLAARMIAYLTFRRWQTPPDVDLIESAFRIEV